MAKRPVERPDVGGPFPEHVAIIMDGNGRWANERGLRRVFGHRRGAQTVRDVTTACAEWGVKSLTLYAFSAENWKRPQREVGYLMRLLQRYLVEERPTLVENDVRLVGMGRLSELPEKALGALRETEALTAEHGGLLLRLALAYGSRAEIADAVRALAEDAVSGALDPATIGEETLRSFLYDPLTPDPDLLIRTAGELRLSNFLLWQASYTELYVTPVRWPEFRREHLLEAFRAYAARTRKYGGLLDDPRAHDRARAGRG